GALTFRMLYGKMLNSAYLLSSSGDIAGHYDKIRLVPFGEYLPMSWILSRHMRTITGVVGLVFGDRDSIFKVGDVKLAVRICYESAFPALGRRAAGAGADVIVNITNDSWYGRTGAEQAVAMTALRAVENERPIVRVANGGFSATISPS